LQDGQSRRREAVEHVAHRLVGAAQLARYQRGSLPTSRSQQDLAATQHKSIGRTQACLDLALFVLG
jgi:hypothetical protein